MICKFMPGEVGEKKFTFLLPLIYLVLNLGCGGLNFLRGSWRCVRVFRSETLDSSIGDGLKGKASFGCLL